MTRRTVPKSKNRHFTPFPIFKNFTAIYYLILTAFEWWVAAVLQMEKLSFVKLKLTKSVVSLKMSSLLDTASFYKIF